MTRTSWPSPVVGLPPRSADVVVCATGAAAVGFCYSGLFAGYSYLGPLTIAAAGSALFAAAAGWAGLAQELRLLASLVGFVVCAEFTLFPADLTHSFAVTQATEALLGALGGGWARMLSVTPPVAASPALLSTPLLLSWASGFVSTTLALGTGNALVPALPVLGAFIAALALTAGLPGTHLLLGGALIALFAVLGILRGARESGPAAAPAVWGGVRGSIAAPAAVSPAWFPLAARRSAAACVMLVFVAGAGVVVGRWAVSDPAAGPRTGLYSLVHAPLRVGGVLSPVVALRGQLLAHSARPLFRMTLGSRPGSSAGRPLRIKLASFGLFDGVLWGSHGTFPVTGGALGGAPLLVHPVRLTEHIQIMHLSTPYLPVLGWPLQITFNGSGAVGQVGYGPGTGALLASGRTRPGLSYDVAAEMTATRALPADAEPGPLTVLGPDLGSRIVLSQQEAGLVRRWIAGQRSPYTALQAVARRLRALPYTLKAPPGESYAVMRQLLAGHEPADDGYDEQHVAAFTLIARWLGYPARVAVGYLAPRPRRGVYTVTGADARAWSEVYFTGYGWVPFDPTYPIANRARKVPGPPPGPALAPGAALSPPPRSPVPTPVPAVSASTLPRALPHGVAVASGWLRWLIVAVGAALAGAGLWLIGGRLGVVAAKAQLRARRRRGTSSQQVAGAWQEAMDRLTELGAEFSPTMTAAEMARHARQVRSPGAESVVGIVRALAVAQTWAVFAPDGCGADAVRRAWHNERRLVKALYPRRFSRRRLRALLDPRPLRTPDGMSGDEVRS
jgi:hypothetical protein